MKQDLFKILILHDHPQKLELIKAQLLHFSNRCLLMVAKSKESFLEKMEWVRPDVVLSDIMVDDLSGVEAMLFVKEKYRKTKFIFIVNEEDADNKLIYPILCAANTFLPIEAITDLPDMLSNVLYEHSLQYQLRLNEEKEELSRKKLLHKAITLIEEGPESEQKKTILNSLQKVQLEIF